jgi:hypothetical protein
MNSCRVRCALSLWRPAGPSLYPRANDESRSQQRRPFSTLMPRRSSGALDRADRITPPRPRNEDVGFGLHPQNAPRHLALESSEPTAILRSRRCPIPFPRPTIAREDRAVIIPRDHATRDRPRLASGRVAPASWSHVPSQNEYLRIDTFEPQLVKKRQRRFDGFGEKIRSRGLYRRRVEGRRSGRSRSRRARDVEHEPEHLDGDPEGAPSRIQRARVVDASPVRGPLQGRLRRPPWETRGRRARRVLSRAATR